MPQGDLGIAQLRQRLVQRAAPHFRAHGAGILLLAVVKNNGADLGLDDVERDAQALTIFRDGRKIHPLQTHVDGDGRQLIGTRIVFPHGRQQSQQGQRVLAAGHADGNPVVGGDHTVVVGAPPHQSHHSLHNQHPFCPKFIKIKRENQRENKRKSKNKRVLSEINQFFKNCP